MEISNSNRSAIELWGGIECTVNRVGDVYLDQLECNDHRLRESDLDEIASLGVRALRYPVLWETTAPDGPESADWRFADQRLNRIRELGIRPIVGLVHHGSGPRHTSMIDPEFPEKLARYARSVAERYPWVADYTPVNEPLTTARFSGLYGHWYPHGQDEATFVRCLLTEIRATVLAMRAVREVNPHARLVQTDDLGKTWSTPVLQYQADFENERRWITWDLLCGKVRPGHRMWYHLKWLGVPDAEIDWFSENPCPPDIIGINHYLTSERFLDDRCDDYPPHVCGGNGQHRYADVEAVRIVAEGLSGARSLLRETWDRYGIPVAITEAHLGCTREEQVRWLVDVWKQAEAAQEDGVDVRAVTVWSLLGAYDWDSLLTRPRGHYEPGVFDLRTPDGHPRPTALAETARKLATGEIPDHPVLDTPGWWKRPVRLLYRPVCAHAETVNSIDVTQDLFAHTAGRPLLIVGATGTLGQAFARICELRGLSYGLVSRSEMDIADAASVERMLDEARPWALVNTAGYARIDDAEDDRYACLRENVKGAVTLANACASRGIKLVTFSSDMVFDGTKAAPYVEGDPAAPLNTYGHSKADAERRIQEALPSALIVRTSALFGPWDEYNFVTTALRALSAELPFRAVDDTIVSPTYVPDLVHATLDLLIDGERGIWHLANPGEISWADLARQAAEIAGLEPVRVESCSSHELGLRASRPRYSALGSERGGLLPPLAASLAHCVHESRRFWREKPQRSFARFTLKTALSRPPVGVDKR